MNFSRSWQAGSLQDYHGQRLPPRRGEPAAWPPATGSPWSYHLGRARPWSNIGRVFARQVSQRCDARTTSTGNAPRRVILAIEPSLGSEGFRITDESKDSVRIIGNDERGLLYGVGKFLRSSRYDQGGFTQEFTVALPRLKDLSRPLCGNALHEFLRSRANSRGAVLHRRPGFVGSQCGDRAFPHVELQRF